MYTQDPYFWRGRDCPSSWNLGRSRRLSEMVGRYGRRRGRRHPDSGAISTVGDLVGDRFLGRVPERKRSRTRIAVVGALLRASAGQLKSRLVRCSPE